MDNEIEKKIDDICIKYFGFLPEPSIDESNMTHMMRERKKGMKKDLSTLVEEARRQEREKIYDLATQTDKNGDVLEPYILLDDIMRYLNSQLEQNAGQKKD